MEKVKIGIDGQKYSESENAIRLYNDYFANLKAAYSSFGLRPLKTEDLKNIFTGETFLKDVVLESTNQTEIAGIKVSRAKLRELVELNGSVYSLNQAIKILLDFQKDNRHLPIFFSDFRVVNDKIVFPDFEKEVRLRCSVFIDDPRRIEFYNTLKQMCVIFNNCKYNHEFNSRIFQNTGYIIMVDGKYSVNIETIRRY